MSKSQLELNDGTLRQRRNLLLVTMLLIFMHHGQVEFGTDVKIFGASAYIGNPDFLLTFLLIIQVYFLWRFYQYFNADGAYSELSNQYRHTLTNRLDGATSQQIFQHLPEGKSTLYGSYSYNKLESLDSRHFHLEVEVPCADFQREKLSVRIPKNPIERQRISVLVGYSVIVNLL